jgi:hypothetical protein
VRMTTNMDVDLRELFVMARVLARPLRKKADQGELTDAAAFMDLAAARRFFGGEDLGSEPSEPTKKEDPQLPLLTRSCATRAM